ncbi:NAD(P)-dependent oxidoreductase [Clostridium intestinale]|uniref:3-hydroxyisobutyrate dehydrogenase n=1 Tax=Clostridium intestinale DSM 6191 TaxID=1121320 RepID=A0A1M5ZKR1_9CLOT|nr:NAD(P)-dependent oxidoreductase [Clostridium intestinale]SHI24830.1 3-hydroxyisobutyrate dehydrogenase [Clostridium intestinale DSM 6191]
MDKDLTVGFIGTGVMGRSMASNILNGGYKLLVNNRTKESADTLVEKGAVWKESIADLAKDADVIITIVGYPNDVENIYFREDGILNNCKKGTIVIDMTTSKPSLAQRIFNEAKEKDISALDSPVSGGDIGARDGKLTIMVGGEKEVFEKVSPLFKLMGTSVNLLGAAGAGQHTKMSNQIAIASNMIGVCEAMVYAKRAGLDPEKVLMTIGGGAAASWSLSNLAPRMIKGDFEPGFYVKHFVKDMKIALEEAENMGIKLLGLELAKSLYDELVEDKKENKGTQVLYQLLDK